MLLYCLPLAVPMINSSCELLRRYPEHINVAPSGEWVWMKCVKWALAHLEQNKHQHCWSCVATW